MARKVNPGRFRSSKAHWRITVAWTEFLGVVGLIFVWWLVVSKLLPRLGVPT